MTRLITTWRNLPLGSKLAVHTSLLIVAVVLALTLLTVQREISNFRDELESQATLLLETLSLTTIDQLFYLEIDELMGVAQVVMRNEGVSSVTIYNGQGVLLIDGPRNSPAFSQEVDPLGAILVAHNPNDIYMDWQTDALVAGRVVMLGNQRIGALAIALSTAELSKKITTLMYQRIVLGVVTLAIGIGLAFWIARQITTPLIDLTDLAVKMAGGNLKTRIKLDAEDEVGQLGRAFNMMADAIEKREAELRELNDSLEQTVKERTSELRKQNKELKKVNAELRIARREAEEATQLKSQFLAAMSHELRTPLNVIMGFSQLLLTGTAGELSAEQAERVERILLSSNILLELINDVLDLAKIEAGRIEIIKKPFAISEWLEDVRHQLESLAKEKEIDFTAELDTNLPITIVGDPIRLRQVTMNLIANAIKFTKEGRITFSVAKLDDTNWTIAVADTGIGIPPHALEYIFDQFRQVDGSIQREFGGTGLGLSIVRNLVVMMGGTIRVTSVVDEGSTFTIRLPLVTELGSSKTSV